ncbi:GFA family protein [Photobacterium sp. R1]
MGVKGGCLCGSVSYKVTGQLLEASNCHCSMCRRQHGAAFATYADVNPTDFHWVDGKEFLQVYETPQGNGWCFCKACGSTLAGTEDGQVTSITLGTVQGDPGITPQSHIFVSSKAPWYQITDSLPQLETRAPGSKRSS